MSALPPLPRDILHCIGNTSLLALRNIVPESGSRILLKLENENPTGSMKRLVPHATVVTVMCDTGMKYLSHHSHP